MKVLWIIGIGIICILLVAVLILFKYGLFASVKISEKPAGPYLLVYKKHIGEYENVGKVMDALYYDLKDNYTIQTTKGFGLYYDNPKEVEKEKLRSIVGCIVEEKTEEEIQRLSQNYNVKLFPETKSVVTEFPYKGVISIYLGIFRVYPKINKFIDSHNYPRIPIMEIYDIPNNKLHYVAPVHLDKNIFDELINVK